MLHVKIFKYTYFAFQKCVEILILLYLFPSIPYILHTLKHVELSERAVYTELELC